MRIQLSSHPSAWQLSSPHMTRLLVEEPLEALVSSQSCDGGGGVAFSVGQAQRFPGSGLLQQEVRHLTETSPSSKVQQSLQRIQVCRRRKNTMEKYGEAKLCT